MEETKSSATEILEFLPGALIEIDIARRLVTYMNRMAIFLFGYHREQVESGIPVQEIFSSKSEYQKAKHLTESFALESYENKTPYARVEEQQLHDFSFRKQNGSIFVGACQGSFILDAEQVPVGVRIYVRDLTEQRNTEKALQVSEEKYRTLVEYSSDLIFQVDAEGYVLSLNQAAAHALDGEPGSVQGKNISSMFSERTTKQYMKSISEVFVSGLGSNHESFQKVGKEKIWINTTLTPIMDASGAVTSVLGVSRDITERKVAEIKIKESDSLRELLLDVVTHDIKTPASVIYGLADMAKEYLPDDEIIESIFLSSQRLLSVLENTSVLSRAVFGEEIPKSVLSLDSLINDLGEDFTSQLENANMSLDITIPKGLEITANPLIGEVVKNYISNAIKYASEGKKIIVEALDGKDSVLIGVKDFGKTISEEKRSFIFERGSQLPGERKRGRGLGLAIVKRISNAHDGDVGVEPNKPTGNIFYLNLPK